MSENKVLQKTSENWKNEYQKAYRMWMGYNQDYRSAKGKDLVSEQEMQKVAELWASYEDFSRQLSKRLFDWWKEQAEQNLYN